MLKNSLKSLFIPSQVHLINGFFEIYVGLESDHAEILPLYLMMAPIAYHGLYPPQIRVRLIIAPHLLYQTHPETPPQTGGPW